MFKKAIDLHQDRLVILVAGQSGAGKNWLAGTLPGKKLGISMEAGGFLCLAGDPELDIYDICVDGNGKELDRSLRIKKFEYCLKEIIPKHPEYDWLIVDSMTELAQLLVENLKKKFPDRSDAFPLWGEYNDTLMALSKNLRDLGKNIYITALESIEKDETGRRFVGIDVNGKISSRLPAFYDEVFYLREFTNDGKTVRKLITGNYQGITAKDRSGKLDLFEDADLGKIINKIKGVTNVE